jgi:pimeloyl-ACP methyl ester carboxylesterase
MKAIAIGGGRIEYRWIDGAAAGPVLVFLHEGLGSVSAWRDVPDALARRTGLPALVYSRHGHGGSDPPPAGRGVRFMHDEATRVLPELLDALGVRDLISIGHSDGASIAIIHAGSRPAVAPRSLVLLAPHVFVEDCSIASISRMRDRYATTDLRDRLARHHGRNVDAAFHGWNDVWLDPAFRAWNIEECLPRIAGPVLVIQGEDDEYGTTRQVEAIARGVTGPLEALVLPACGHAPHRDQRDAVLDAIAGFIARA